MSSSFKPNSQDSSDMPSSSIVLKDSPKVEGVAKVSPSTQKVLLAPIQLTNLKASPKQYLSPQLKSTKKVILDGRSSVFSPLVRNRGIQAVNSPGSVSSHNLGLGTPSQFKHHDQKLSPSQNTTQVFGEFKNEIPASVLQNLQALAQARVHQKDGNAERNSLQLPSISVNKNSQNVDKVKNTLSLLDEKPSFFNEVNKYARKSLLVPSTTSFQASDQSAPSTPMDGINLEQLAQLSPSINSPSKKNLPYQAHPVSTFKRPSALVASQTPTGTDILKNLSSSSKSSQDLYSYNNQKFQQLPPAHLSSLGSEKGSQSNNSQDEDSGTPSSFNALARGATQNHPFHQRRSKFNQISEIKEINDQFFSLQNSPNLANYEPQKAEKIKESKDSPEEDSAQSESSEGELPSTPNEMKNQTIEKVAFRTRKVEPSKFLSPQLTGNSNFRRLSKQEASSGNTTNGNILLQLSNMPGKKKDNKQDQFEMKQKQEEQAGLLRELQYLSSEMKKYVIEGVDKAENLKKGILSFCMIHDLQEFSFYFGQFLDHVFEERIIGEATSSLKMPVSLFSQVEALMNQFLDEQKKSQELKDLFKLQLSKHNYLISPSTLLEQLGGYRKMSNISQQFASLLLSSTLQNYLFQHQESEAAEKIQEFLISALQGDANKVTQLIDSMKKVTSTSPTCTEYFVLKKLLFQFFQKRPYFSKDVRDSFLELLETYRYFFTSEEGFTSKQLSEIKGEIIRQILILWKQDPFLQVLHESSKGQLQVFVQELFYYMFSQRNCYELRSSFNSAFLGQKFDMFIVAALNQLIQAMVRKVGIKQNVLVKNIVYAFDKLTWLVSPDNNLVEIIGDYQEIQEAMIVIISQQMSSLKQTPSDQGSLSQNTQAESQQQSSQGSLTAFDTIGQDGAMSEQQSHSMKFQRLKEQKASHLINESIMSDVTNFSEFLGMYFNFRTTYHYTDLLCFFASEKNTFEVFVYWSSVIAESIMEVRGISQQKSDQIKEYITNLFNIKNN